MRTNLQRLRELADEPMLPMDTDRLVLLAAVWELEAERTARQQAEAERDKAEVELDALVVALRTLVAMWRANAGVLMEGTKGEVGDDGAGMQLALANQLEAALAAVSPPAGPSRPSDVPAS